MVQRDGPGPWLLTPVYGFHDLLRGVVKIVSRQHVQSRFADNLLALFDIGALEPHHQRYLEANLLHGPDHALGNHVASHDAAEDVDQDALYVGIGGDDLEGRGDLFHGGAAADIEEVCRLHAVELDDVHGRHGKARAVDHAADRAVERDIVEVKFGRLDLLGVFFGRIAQRHHLGMAEQRVVVEGNLGVEDAELALLGDDQRVDLQHRHVLGDEGIVELGGQLLRLLGEVARQVQRLGDRAAVMAHDAGGGIDREGDDLLRRRMRDVLDVHAAFGRRDEGDFAGFAVDQDRKVELLVDVGAFLDVEAIDLL